MAQISIRQALRFSIFMYARNVLLFLMVSVLMGVSIWASKMVPRLLKEKLECGVPFVTKVEYTTTEIPTTLSFGQSEMVVKKVQDIVTSKVMKRFGNAPLHSTFARILVQALFLIWNMFLMMGFVKLALTLKDTGKASIGTLFETHVFFNWWFQASCLFQLYLIFIGCVIDLLVTIFVDLSPLFIHLKWMMIALIVAGAFGPIIGILFWTMTNAFFGYCLVDSRAHGVLEALSESRRLARGHVLHLVTAFFCFLFLCLAVFVIGVFLFDILSIQSLQGNKELISSLFSGVFLSLGSLYFASIYRDLTR